MSFRTFRAFVWTLAPLTVAGVFACGGTSSNDLFGSSEGVRPVGSVGGSGGGLGDGVGGGATLTGGSINGSGGASDNGGSSSGSGGAQGGDSSGVGGAPAVGSAGTATPEVPADSGSGAGGSAAENGGASGGAGTNGGGNGGSGGLKADAGKETGGGGGSVVDGGGGSVVDASRDVVNQCSFATSACATCEDRACADEMRACDQARGCAADLVQLEACLCDGRPGRKDMCATNFSNQGREQDRLVRCIQVGCAACEVP